VPRRRSLPGRNAADIVHRRRLYADGLLFDLQIIDEAYQLPDYQSNWPTSGIELPAAPFQFCW
jgi:hypothetical protein